MKISIDLITEYSFKIEFLNCLCYVLGAETFHVNTAQAYVTQQPPNQSNQGPGIRAMAPTGPPNQASTPPNTELKQITQPATINMVSQKQKRLTLVLYKLRTFANYLRISCNLQITSEQNSNNKSLRDLAKQYLVIKKRVFQCF